MTTRNLKVLGLITVFSLLLLAAGCSQGDKNMSTDFHTLHERDYIVSLNVRNMQSQPVEGTRVYLMKKAYGHPLDQDGEFQIPKQEFEQMLGTTDPSGEFLLDFEPRGADDVWLYFDASNQGYQPQMVKLNDMLGDSIFDSPGYSPNRVNVILEPQQN